MKAIFFVAVLLFGSSTAKPHLEKRAPTCSDFPKQLSGRLVTSVKMDSGLSMTIDTRFHLDMNLQRFQGDITTQGQSYTIYVDYKNSKYYLVHPGGCLANDADSDEPLLPNIPEAPQLLKPIASGKLGLNGASIDLYSDDADGSFTVVTLESGNKCIPVSFASKQKDGSSTGSFLDLQTTGDPEKMKIPEECLHNNMEARSSTRAILHAVKRGFPWLGGKKRGFPWVEVSKENKVTEDKTKDSSGRKRGFPWIQDKKRGFPWVKSTKVEENNNNGRKRGFPWI